MKKAITFLVTAAMAVTAYAYDKPTAVDMGISVKFASGVITTEGSPNYFYFGETVPPQTMNQLHSFSGVKIGSDISGTLYDAATMNLGKEWRMPTKQEMQELIDNTVVESATVNSKKGLKFTAEMEIQYLSLHQAVIAHGHPLRTIAPFLIQMRLPWLCM